MSSEANCLVVRIERAGGKRKWKISPGLELATLDQARADIARLAAQYPHDEFVIVAEIAIAERRTGIDVRQTAAFVRDEPPGKVARISR